MLVGVAGGGGQGHVLARPCVVVASTFISDTMDLVNRLTTRFVSKCKMCRYVC